jgi:heavy metal efflux system protein
VPSKSAYQRGRHQLTYSLRGLATITHEAGASCIYHETSQRYIPIKFGVRGRDLGGAVAEAQARIAKNVKLPIVYRLV